jgi:MFS family permease
MTKEPLEKPLNLSKFIVLAGAFQVFADQLYNRFIQLLAVAAGATVDQLGILNAVKSVAGNILQIFFGRMADRFGKRRFIAIGRFLNGVVLVAIIFIETPSWLIPLIVLCAIFVSMALPSWSSLLGDYAPEGRRGEVIGRINSLTQIGGLSAMLIALFISLFQVGPSTRISYIPVMAMASGASFLSGVLVLFTEEKHRIKVAATLDFRRLLGDIRLRRYLILNSFYGLGMAFAWPLFPFIIIQKLEMPVWQVAILAITETSANILTQRFTGRFMDKAGRRPIIVFSRIVMALAPLSYAFATSWIHIVVAEIFLGIGMGAWMSSESTYVIDLAPGELRATYLAASATAFGLASFGGSLLGSYVTEHVLTNGGMEAINMGLIISAVLRILLGAAYVTAFESRPGKQRLSSST